mgnify:CR=1 FL=1
MQDLSSPQLLQLVSWVLEELWVPEKSSEVALEVLATWIISPGRGIEERQKTSRGNDFSCAGEKATVSWMTCPRAPLAVTRTPAKQATN